MAVPATPDDAAIQQILTTARAGEPPRGWFVWRLRRDRVLRAALGWLLIALFGFVVLVPVFLATVPYNFQSSAAMAAVTIILLAMLAAIAFGGLGLGVADLSRYLRADQYLLVMTPDDFLKAMPGRVVHVPMTAVAFVTLKGVRMQAARAAPSSTNATIGAIWSSVLGQGNSYRRSARSAPSLAFLDQRTNRHVVVATDDSFDDLPVLEEVLNLYARGQPILPERTRTRR